jgi:chemotaxis protein methyltransferase CheR
VETNVDTNFDYVRTLVLADAGIVLEPGKEYLLESRLAPVAKGQGLGTVHALIDALRSGRQPQLRRRVLDAMTTNETTFFRDAKPFEFLEEAVLPATIAARRPQQRLRIWHAASSTGQEPYTVSMIMREKFPELQTWAIEQFATDISQAALDRARAGRYSQLEVNRGLPARYLLKYFTKHGLEWHISDAIRGMVKYEELNLNGNWPAMPRFDIIFIRNVMIYFDVAAKKKILGRIADLLQPDGWLFLGAAETTMNLDDRFVRTDFNRAGCYRLASS